MLSIFAYDADFLCRSVDIISTKKSNNNEMGY